MERAPNGLANLGRHWRPIAPWLTFRIARYPPATRKQSSRIGKPFPTDGDLTQTPNRCSNSVRSESQSELTVSTDLEEGCSEWDENAVMW